MPTQTARIVIALTAAATLMLQIMLTRVFSAMVFYHFAFAAVSLTMTTLQASGLSPRPNIRPATGGITTVFSVSGRNVTTSSV